PRLRVRSSSAPASSSASVVSRLRCCRDGVTPGRSSSGLCCIWRLRLLIIIIIIRIMILGKSGRAPDPGRRAAINAAVTGREEGMSANETPFGGSIGKTVAGSKPWWPQPPKPPAGAPNILVVLFDDVGFSDFGCYGSVIKTPTIDRLAAEGLRYSGFHTTAMCSTTRAALLTGRNHHSVGVGCLANFDSGYPGYRGKIAREAGTLAEMLRAHAYRNYMIGKWH